MSEFIWAAVVAILLAGTLAYLYLRENKKNKKPMEPSIQRETTSSNGTLPLRLQAYERLLLLSDRIALPNLVSRFNQSGLSLKEMQVLFTQTIRQEFDHNITQQMYVSPEAWDAVRNLKEQNLLIVNQIASFMPADASGTDLCKALLELIMQNPKASLHSVEADALSYEAKKLLD